MAELEYSYVVIKYRHDPAAGEVMNVGVALYIPETGQIGFHYDSHYARLSSAFSHFDGSLYKATMSKVSNAFRKYAEGLSDHLFQVEARSQLEDIGVLFRELWNDQGLSYFPSGVKFGVTGSPDAELDRLYDRFVLSQFDSRESAARFNDEALWSSFERSLSKPVLKVLRPQAIGPDGVEFDYAYQNGKWHVIEPVSLDYTNRSQMKERALTTLGRASALVGVKDFGSYTVLVAKPRRLEPGKSFQEALNLLNRLPGEHQVYLEEESGILASRLEADMVLHGLIEATAAK